MRRFFCIVGIIAWSLSSISLADDFGFDDDKSEKRAKRRLVRFDEDSGSRLGSSKIERRRSDYKNYLPFGTGQFLQGKTWLGTGLAAAQSSFFLLYYSRLSQLKEANADATSVMDANGPQGISGNSTLLMYMDQNEKIAREARQDAQMYLVAFLGLYAFGVVDAIYDPFDTSSFSFGKRNATARENKRRRSRESKDGFTREEARRGRKQVSLMLTPGEKKPGYGLSLATDL